MKLPNLEKAFVPSAKITDYLLSTAHSTGQSKAQFFMHFRFSRDRWEVLADALLEHANQHDVVRVEQSPFGQRYVIECELQTPDGENPCVRVVWFIDEGEDAPRLVTAYPLRS